MFLNDSNVFERDIRISVFFFIREQYEINIHKSRWVNIVTTSDQKSSPGINRKMIFQFNFDSPILKGKGVINKGGWYFE